MELRDKYYDRLGFKDKASMRDALERAHQLRMFEIELYWKRATYFWAFQVAIFAAFGLLWRQPDANDWSPVTVALAGLGILTAFANTLSICGSKFWQKNWERHIEMLEDEKEGRLYKTVWLQKGKGSFSVSGINKYLSCYFIAFWVIVTLYVMWKFVGSPLNWPGCIPPACIYVLVVLFMIVVGGVLLFCQRSNLGGKVRLTEDSQGSCDRGS